MLTDPGVESTELGNGLRIVTERMPEARSVTIGAWIGVGGRDEVDLESGVSHFLEHLLFKGTEARSARHIAEAVEAVGGEVNAFTAREHTAFYAWLPWWHLELGMEVLGDVLTAPAFRPAEIEAERQVIVEEILMSRDSPEDRVHTLLAEALFPDHPLGRDVLGTPETVGGLAREQIAAFFECWYRPAAMVLAVAGNLDHAAVVDLAERGFAQRAGGELPVRAAPEVAPRAVSVEHDVTEQAHLCLGWHGVPHGDSARWALEVANHILGGASASRLFQEVREERGLAYSVYSHLSGYADAGSLSVYCGSAPARLREALQVIDGVIAGLLDRGVSEAEVARAQGFLEGSFELSLEDSGGRMTRLGRTLVRGEELDSAEQHLARIRAVTVDEVDQVLRQVLAGPRSLAAVGPFDESFLLA